MSAVLGAGDLVGPKCLKKNTRKSFEGKLREIHLKMFIEPPSEYLPLLFWKIAESGFLLLFPDRGIPTPSATWWLFSHLS